MTDQMIAMRRSELVDGIRKAWLRGYCHAALGDPLAAMEAVERALRLRMRRPKSAESRV